MPTRRPIPVMDVPGKFGVVPAVLVVDDYPQGLHLALTMLRKAGYLPFGAGSAARALTLLPTVQPALIILDVRMPEMNGLDLCRQLKADPATSHIPIVFVSAVAEAGVIQAAYACGAVDFITKPFNLAQLMACVNQHVPLTSQPDPG